MWRIQEVIDYMATGVFIKIMTPDWLLRLGLTERMRHTRIAFKELEVCRSSFII